mmetsp:Transcript_3267/g.5031  ORF Transcript_3267/g.5031 Transcript_3267/m.5031 type:complete len:155 (+) Transcript_3267:34-498(+)
MASQRNLYDVLQVKKTANSQDIKKAYKKLALEWHPDKNPNCAFEAKAKFQEIKNAYNTLCNSEKRDEYDLADKSHRKTTRQKDDLLSNILAQVNKFQKHSETKESFLAQFERAKRQRVSTRKPPEEEESCDSDEAWEWVYGTSCSSTKKKRSAR